LLFRQVDGANPTYNVYLNDGWLAADYFPASAYLRFWIRVRLYPLTSRVTVAWCDSSLNAGGIVLSLTSAGVLTVDNFQSTIREGAIGPTIPLNVWCKIELYCKHNTQANVIPNPPFETNAACTVTVSGGVEGSATITFDTAATGVGLNDNNPTTGGIERFGLGQGLASVADTGADFDISHIAAGDEACGDTRVTWVPITATGTYATWPTGIADWRARNVMYHNAALLDQAVSTLAVSARQSYLCDLAAVGVTGSIFGAQVMARLRGESPVHVGLRFFVRRNGVDTDSHVFAGSTSSLWIYARFDTTGWLATDTIEIGIVSRTDGAGAERTEIEGLCLLLDHDSPVTPITQDEVRTFRGSYTGTAAPQTIALAFAPHVLLVQPRSAAANRPAGIWFDSMRTGHDTSDMGRSRAQFRVDGSTLYLIDNLDWCNESGMVYDYIAIRDPSFRAFGRGSFYQRSTTTPRDTDNWAVPIGAETGVGSVSAWQPDALLFCRETDDSALASFMRGAGHVGDLSSNIGTLGAPAADRIQQLTATGWEAGKGSFSTSAYNYPFLGIRTTAFNATQLARTTSYVGDGTASQVVTVNMGGLPPAWVWVVPHNTGRHYWRHCNSPATLRSIDGGGSSATAITALGVDSMTVGVTLNTAGVTYTVIAFLCGVDCSDVNGSIDYGSCLPDTPTVVAGTVGPGGSGFGMDPLSGSDSGGGSGAGVDPLHGSDSGGGSGFAVDL
jgi:hypothetical protein